MKPTSFHRVFFRGVSGSFLAIVLFFGAVYSLSWSGFFIWPQSMLVTPDGTVFVRKTPFGSVDAAWVMEVTPPDGQECPSAISTNTIQRAPNNTVRLRIPLLVRSCTVPGAVVEVSFTVKLLGLHMRPVRVTTIVVGEMTG